MVILHEHVDTIKQRRFINNADTCLSSVIQSVNKRLMFVYFRDVRGIP